MNKRIGNIFKGDKVIWMVFLFLCLISIVEVFSASSTLTYKSNNYMGPISYHAVMIFLGVIVTVVTLNVPCRYFKLMTPFLLFISAVLLVWVLIFGEKTNDAGRWISLFGFSFQPSELAKGTMVLVTAQILSAMQRENGADPRAFKWIMWFTGIAVLLIGKENLSTAALLLVVIILMMIIGRVPWRQTGWLVGILGIACVFAVAVIMLLGDTEKEKQTTKDVMTEVQKPEEESFWEKSLHRADTWKGRIISFFEPWPPPEKFDLDKNCQVGHANIAIASSEIIGKGPGNSLERDYLPQAFSDFIYAIVIEETGLFGAAFVAFLYIVLLFRTARIASRCENNFPAFLIMGLSLLLVIQATFNMMVAVGLAPVTGQPLPLISKGGTSTIINCAYIGVMLSISRSAKMKKAVSEN